MRVGLLVVLTVVAACGDEDGPSGGGRDDAGLGGGGNVDAAACTGQSVVIGSSASGGCAFEVPVSFDPARINIAVVTPTSREIVCHTLRERDCTGSGWSWSPETHEVALCAEACAAFATLGAELVVETGCATASCGGGSCTQATGYCTHATASQCCSGRCDGDSCGSGLWGPCPGMFGCFEGTCQDGFCKCPPGDLQCGANCFDPMLSNAHCGACDNACTGGKTCEAGDCTCPTGFTDCSGTCVDVTTDAANCGMCGMACRADQVCSATGCACPGTQRECNGVCVEITNPLHCGACNNACDAATETCTAFGAGASCACNAGLFDCGGNGTCEDRMTDENNCGTCGRVCPGNKTCINGDC